VELYIKVLVFIQQNIEVKNIKERQKKSRRVLQTVQQVAVHLPVHPVLPQVVLPVGKSKNGI